MYFTTEELEITLPLEARKKPKKWIHDNLKAISKLVSAQSSHYRTYGAYWWEVKRLLKQRLVGNGNKWYMGSSMDEDARIGSDHGSDVLNVHAALRYQAILGPDTPWIDREVSAWHICEWANGFVELYRISDTDAGHQLDLFSPPRTGEEKMDQYLNSIVDFLPRTWRNWGDKAMRNGNADEAAAYYKRMTLLAGNSMDRTEGWLLQGMTFDHKAHYHKAIYCYMNLYEKDKQHWVLGNIAASYAMAGEYSKSVECYIQALRHMPGNPEFEAGVNRARQKLASSEKLLMEWMSA